MSLQNKEQRLTYIIRGKNRCKIYKILLVSPRSISEISKKTGISLSNVSRVIKQLEQHSLVENLTPSQRVGSLYQLTSLALEFKSEFKEHMQFIGLE